MTAWLTSVDQSGTPQRPVVSHMFPPCRSAENDIQPNEQRFSLANTVDLAIFI